MPLPFPLQGRPSFFLLSFYFHFQSHFLSLLSITELQWAPFQLLFLLKMTCYYCLSSLPALQSSATQLSSSIVNRKSSVDVCLRLPVSRQKSMKLLGAKCWLEARAWGWPGRRFSPFLTFWAAKLDTTLDQRSAPNPEHVHCNGIVLSNRLAYLSHILRFCCRQVAYDWLHEWCNIQSESSRHLSRQVFFSQAAVSTQTAPRANPLSFNYACKIFLYKEPARCCMWLKSWCTHRLCCPACSYGLGCMYQCIKHAGLRNVQAHRNHTDCPTIRWFTKELKAVNMATQSCPSKPCFSTETAINLGHNSVDTVRKEWQDGWSRTVPDHSDFQCTAQLGSKYSALFSWNRRAGRLTRYEEVKCWGEHSFQIFQEVPASITNMMRLRRPLVSQHRQWAWTNSECSDEDR